MRMQNENKMKNDQRSRAGDRSQTPSESWRERERETNGPSFHSFIGIFFLILSVVRIRKVKKSSTVRLDDAAPKLPPILRQMGARSDSRDGTVEIEERKKPADRERQREREREREVSLTRFRQVFDHGQGDDWSSDFLTEHSASRLV